ncbi:transposase [Cyanobium sp. ATX 6A2]|uniref:transposase n=1 Tax=Cyanobium sp. ATX 6A2 TaxID=2823700 RepID=UPI0020CEEBDB|nr:transposase [Cyanobium sp. ATX 6A2]
MRLRKAGVIDELFERFEEHLRFQGLEARGGQIIDATLIPVPKERNSRFGNEGIRRGQQSDIWLDKPERLWQRDLDAHWVTIIGISHYGYKNGICIDAEHGFMRRYAITPPNIHDSQMIPQGLNPENRDDFVWADSGYAGARFEDLLEVAGFESRIHEKVSRCHPLSKEAKERNKVRLTVLARVEHVFGAITTGLRGKLTRRIGLARTMSWWGLRNLRYYFLCCIHCCSRPWLAV